MKFSPGAAMLVAVVLTASACGSSHPTAGSPTSETVSSSRLILGGAVRGTATLTTPVQAGHELSITFKFHNLTARAVSVPISYGGMWVIVRSPDGTTYDTRVPLENERFAATDPISVPAGGTKTERLPGDFLVRWEGPLRITPGCGLSAARTVRVAVASPGLPPSPRAAVTEVVAATQHLLDHCRPRTSGVAVVGRIDPPSGHWPPLQARCSIALSREGDFYRAQVLIVTPPDLQGVHLDQTYEAVSGTYDPNRNTQVIAWQFVVTRHGATSIDATSHRTTLPRNRMAPDWVWTRRTSPGSGGLARCGFSGGGGGGLGGPDVYFINACGR